MTTQEVNSPVNIKARKELGIKSGDTVRVTQKIKEKEKIRLQVFEGLVLTVKHGTEAGSTFSVRKIASGVGVEKIFPLYSPMIDKIEIVKRTKTRRAKLYYIRKKAAKEIRRAMRRAYAVGVSTGSDIAEKERLASEVEETEKKKQEEEAKAVEEAKKEEEKVETDTENKEEDKKEEEEKDEVEKTKEDDSEKENESKDEDRKEDK